MHVCATDVAFALPIEQCVNTVNAERPEEFEYITERTHQPDVSLHTDSASMVCCSCTNGCQNRSECECWKRTFKGSGEDS